MLTQPAVNPYRTDGTASTWIARQGCLEGQGVPPGSVYTTGRAQYKSKNAKLLCSKTTQDFPERPIGARSQVQELGLCTRPVPRPGGLPGAHRSLCTLQWGLTKCSVPRCVTSSSGRTSLKPSLRSRWRPLAPRTRPLRRGRPRRRLPAVFTGC